MIAIRRIKDCNPSNEGLLFIESKNCYPLNQVLLSLKPMNIIFHVFAQNTKHLETKWNFTRLFFSNLADFARST